MVIVRLCDENEDVVGAFSCELEEKGVMRITTKSGSSYAEVGPDHLVVSIVVPGILTAEPAELKRIEKEKEEAEKAEKDKKHEVKKEESK